MTHGTGPLNSTGEENEMADSIIILGPQGCGKTINAEALAKAFGFEQWCEADDGTLPRTGYLILANWMPDDCDLRVITFAEAIKKVPHPHPSTPRT
jgi:DNA polymerase III delta prime subunit